MHLDDVELVLRCHAGKDWGFDEPSKFLNGPPLDI